MKYLILFIFIFSTLPADEIQRIESIVKDISDLRSKYELSEENLQLEIKKQNQQKKSISKLDKTVKSLENQINKYKKLLKTKENEIAKLKKRKPIKVKHKTDKPNNIIVYKRQKFDNPNKFPQLVLKNKYIKYIEKRTKANTYKLLLDTKIYDAVNGKVIENWEKDTSFTSHTNASAKNKDTWVKITGFFINNTWVPSQSNMWIKLKYIRKK